MATFTARTLPWMTIGTVIDEPVTAAEAAKLGGLDFDVELRPAGYRNAKGNWQRIADRVAVVHAETSEFFNYASSDYQPVQYAEAFDFLDAINPQIVAAGSLRGGRQGFMVTQLPEHTSLDVELKGVVDSHELYVVVRTSHDLSKGIEVAIVLLRHKCMNQLTLPSLTRDAPQRWSIRHVGDPKAKLAEAETLLTNTVGYEQAFRELTERLVDVDVSEESAKIILKRVLPDRPTRETKQIPAILDAFRGSEHVGFENTGWGLVNAVSEYFEWQRPVTKSRTDESRFKGALDGATHHNVARTAELVLAR